MLFHNRLFDDTRGIEVIMFLILDVYWSARDLAFCLTVSLIMSNLNTLLMWEVDRMQFLLDKLFHRLFIYFNSFLVL